MNKISLERPKFIVLYNQTNKEGKWVGTGYQFFDDYDLALDHYHYLCYQSGLCATLRGYNEIEDCKYLGAVHSMK